MAQEEGVLSLKDRIARLQLNQVGPVPSVARPKPAPPPRPDLPARPAAVTRTHSTNNPPVQDHVPINQSMDNLPERDLPLVVNSNGMDGTSRPALPPRTSTRSSLAPAPGTAPRRPSGPSPSLPPRRPSEAPSQPDYQLSRRTSSDSVSSVATARSARSSVSGISNATSITSQGDRSVKAPSYDPSALPTLPPKRTEEQKQAYYKSGSTSGRRPLKSTFSSPNIAKQIGTTPPPPARPSGNPPPVVPSRSATLQTEQPLQIEPAPQPSRHTAPPPQISRKIEPPPPARKSALDFGMNKSTNTAPPVPTTRPGSVPTPQANGTPPPIPTGSRPDLAALQSSKPKFGGGNAASSVHAAAGPPGSCLLCRDFSGPDNHAARFPREALPYTDLDWLSQQLTAPFPSATDKARAIFTWLHHNIAYDTVAFFGNNVKSSTPQSTLQSGLAVCEGYAGLFCALAMKAGLESYVVSGHGKGYGYSALKPGEPIPPYSAGHAWSVVKIDDGQWKLTDPCWGAGAVNCPNQPYKKRFAPERFTQSNEDFGMDHFPGDASQQFRSDGRVVTWEEYYTGNKNGTGADIFGGYMTEEGLAPRSFRPVAHDIVLAQQGPTVRFAFQKICPHWDPVRCGRGPYYLYVLHLEGLDGTDRNHIPFETNGDVWWCDVPVRDLGRPGQKAGIDAVSTFDGRDGRGVTIQEYRARKGRVGMSFGWVCKWQVA